MSQKIVLSVSRADVSSQMGKEVADKLDDYDILWLADKIGDALNEAYWDAMEVLVEERLEENSATLPD